MSLYEKEIAQIAKNAGIGASSILIFYSIAYVSSILIVKVVGAASYGVFYLANTILEVGVLLAALGLDQGVLRYVSLYAGQGNLTRVKGSVLFGMRVTLISSLSLSILIFALAPWLAEAVFQEPELTAALRILIVGLPFSVLTLVLLSGLQGLRLIKFFALTKNILQPLTRLVVLVAVFLIGWKLSGLIWATLISIVAGFGLAYYFLRANASNLGHAVQASVIKSEIVSFSMPLLFEGFLNRIIDTGPALLLGFFGSSTEVGVYGIVLNLGLIVALPLTAFNLVFAPTISNLQGRREHEALARLFKTTTKWTFTLSFLAFLAIGLFAKPILSIFGPEFVMGAGALIILILGRLVDSSVGAVGQMLTMTGRPKLSLLNACILCALALALSVWLIPGYGINGAALATALPVALVNILRLAEVYYYEHVHPYHRNFLKPLVVGLVSAVMVLLLGRFVPYDHNLPLATLFGIGFLLLYGALLRLFCLDDEDFLVLGLVGKRLRLVQ